MIKRAVLTGGIGLVLAGVILAAVIVRPFGSDALGQQPSSSATPGRVGLNAPALPSYLVLIVLDGSRPDYFKVPNIPHVQALIHGGTHYTNAWAGILESETPSGHASLGTGSMPKADGILSFAWANADNIDVNLFSPTKVRDGDMEKVIRDSGAPTIAGLVHAQNPGAKVVALSGYKYYAADAMGGPNADVIMYYDTRQDGSFGPVAIPGHLPPETVMNPPDLASKSRKMPFGHGNHLAMKLARTSFQQMHQQVTLINLPESDWPLGHSWGADRDPKDVTILMHDFDKDLAMLENTYRKAGVLDRTTFVVTSDHGFAPIYHTVQKDVILDAVTKTGTTVLRDTYHTGAYLWLKDESKAEAAATNIANLKNPNIQSVYVRKVGPKGPTYVRATPWSVFQTTGVEHANQYLLNTFNGPNGPDLAVIFKEHSAGTDKGQAGWKGDHGGAAWESQHIPLIISGPGIKANQVSSYPARIMDIAPTVLANLNSADTGMQGIVLADALKNPTAAQVSAQRTERKTLTPVVSALKRESRLEVKAQGS